MLSLLLASLALVAKEKGLQRPEQGAGEGCLSCHAKVGDPDPSHPISSFGCHICHLGNPYSFDKERAHLCMVRNPGDLRVVERTCGRGGCHGDMVARVKKGIMATNRGILKTLQSHWLAAPGREASDKKRAKGGVQRAVGVEDLLMENPPENLAIDHYRKMCGGCHLWKKRGALSREIGRRGGGCSDCHILDEPREGASEKGPIVHPAMTTRIPSENCVKCHNRSARIGLSYFGRYESPGYGTPYEGRALNSRRLSGGRFWLKLQGDVHFSQWGMACIDCHTATGLMGDGQTYDEMEDQTDIACQNCHRPRFRTVSEGDAQANRLASLNRKVPSVLGKEVALSRKGTPLYNLQAHEGKVVFFRKRDGRAIEMTHSSLDKSYHTLPGHERLSCQACHSAWIPQCYGCHLSYRKSGLQRDWFTKEVSPGRWKETRSYLRFSKPALVVRDSNRIYPVTPCQVFVSLFDEDNRYRSAESFSVLTIAAYDPHTTSKGSRPCLECHSDPKTLGFGEGLIRHEEGKRLFRPTYDGAASGLGISFPLDAVVSPGGRPLLVASREGTRPFNKEELDSILSVNACLGCHARYDDPLYQDFKGGRARFDGDDGLPCKR